MDLRQLHRLDLNLLVALQTLLEEGNVSRAAERLFISQPAMSKTLGRLRDAFDDPLFIRTPHGLRPTPRALSLREPLQSLLENIQSLVNEAPFDPASYEGEFIIAISEYLGITIIPELMAKLQSAAPGIRIKVVTRMEHQLEQLAEGNLDFALHMERRHYDETFNCSYLGTFGAVLIMREGHPLSQGPITLEDLSHYPSVGFYVADREEIDAFQQLPDLDTQAPHLIPRLELSHLLTAMEVARNGDYFFAAPPQVALLPHVTNGLVLVPAPFAEQTQVSQVLVSHRLTDNSAAHAWLRVCLEEIALENHRRIEQLMKIYARTG